MAINFLCGSSNRGRLLAVMIMLTVNSTVHAAGHPKPSQDGSTPGDTAAAARQIDAANGMLSRGLYDLAEVEYRAALSANANDATNASARYGLAICMYRQNQFAETVTALKPLLEDDRFAYGAEVGIMQGQSQLALGGYDEAVDAFKAVAITHPSHKLASQAIVGAIEALYQSGANAEAVRYAKKMTDRIAHKPTQNRAELLQAAALLNLQDASGAATILKRLHDGELDSQFATQVKMLLGQCARLTGNHADAVTWFGKVLSDGAGAFENDAQLGLADALYRLGNFEESERAIQSILKSSPAKPLRADATLLLGRVHFDKGAFALARKAFEAVHDIGQANRAEAEYWIAKCALRMGSAREAVELFDRWNKANSEHAMKAEAAYDHAVALIEAGQFDEASTVLQRFRKRFPGHQLGSATLHLLAVTAYRKGDDGACEQLCVAYTDQFPSGAELADVMSLAGRSTFRDEQWQSSVRWNTQFAKQFSADARVAEANFRAGLAAYRLEDFTAAEKFFVTLLVDQQMPEAFSVASLALGDIRFQEKDWPAADRWLSNYLATGSAPPSGDEALLKRGIARRRMNDSASALVDFDALVKRWPESAHRARALLERGEVLALRGDNSAANQAFEEAAKANGGQGVATHAAYQRAVLAMQSGRYAEAAEQLTAFLASEVDHDRRAEALYQRGQCWLGAGVLEKAQADFLDVLDKHSDHARADDSAAWSFVALVRQDKVADAQKFWSKHLPSVLERLDAGVRVTVLYERAWALRASGDSEQAARAYGVVLSQAKVDPATRAHAMLGLAEIEIDGGGCGAGSKRLRDLVATNSSGSGVPSVVRERALYRLGSCAIESEEWQEASALFAALLEEFPANANSTSVHLYYGEALLQLGHHSQAREHLEQVTGNCDDANVCSAALLRLGECFAAQHQWAMSERVLQDFLARFGESEVWYQAQFGLAWAREHQDRLDDAINAYREVVDRHRGPTAARAQFQIGECLFAKGEHEAAAREFLKVDILYNYPEWSAAALYETGRCFELLDKRVEAKSNFQAVIDRFGDSKWAEPAAKRIPRLTASVVPGH